MATATNQYQDWSGVSVTPAGNSLVSIPDVTRVSIDEQVVTAEYLADLDVFARVVASPTERRRMRIYSTAAQILLALPKGTPCTVVAILGDLTNGTGSGAITFTLSDAVIVGRKIDNTHGKVAAHYVEFLAAAPDGQTDPLAYAIAS